MNARSYPAPRGAALPTPATFALGADAKGRPQRGVSLALAAAAVAWGGTVAVAAGSGVLGRLWMPAIAGLVALGIAAPTAVYVMVPAVRRWAERVGLRAITAFHAWRVAAALVFIWYGVRGELPPVFWILAGGGDLIAGVWAVAITRRPHATREDYRAMHRFGFVDFVVAVGTGLTFTLLGDPRMAPIAQLPLALIPLFGVGLSGAAHLVAFDLMRRSASAAPSAAGAASARTVA